MTDTTTTGRRRLSLTGKGGLRPALFFEDKVERVAWNR